MHGRKGTTACHTMTGSRQWYTLPEKKKKKNKKKKRNTTIRQEEPESPPPWSNICGRTGGGAVGRVGRHVPRPKGVTAVRLEPRHHRVHGLGCLGDRVLLNCKRHIVEIAVAGTWGQGASGRVFALVLWRANGKAIPTPILPLSAAPTPLENEGASPPSEAPAD